MVGWDRYMPSLRGVSRFPARFAATLREEARATRIQNAAVAKRATDAHSIAKKPAA